MKKPIKRPSSLTYKNLLLVGVALVAFAPVIYGVLFLVGGFFCEPTVTNTCNLEGDILRHLLALLVASVFGLIGIILLIVAFFKFYGAERSK